MRKLIMILAAATSLAAATPASADSVADWWDFANRVSNAAGVQSGMGTPENSRAVSRTALAMFEAVNAIDRRYQSYLNFPASDSSASVVTRGCVASQFLATRRGWPSARSCATGGARSGDRQRSRRAD